MTVYYSRNMPHQATYWPATENPDGFGSFLMGSPTLVSCRWQDKAELFRDNLGREVVSSSIAYVGSLVSQRGYLALGDWTVDADPKSNLFAREVRAVQLSPGLRDEETLVKAMM